MYSFSVLERLFWGIAVLVMFAIGSILTNDLRLNWEDNVTNLVTDIRYLNKYSTLYIAAAYQL